MAVTFVNCVFYKKIWIQWDDTEESVASDLLAAGVPKEDIVLGFRHPRIRQHTDFVVA